MGGGDGAAANGDIFHGRKTLRLVWMIYDG